MVVQTGNSEIVSKGGDSEIVASTTSLPVSQNPSTAVPKYPTCVPILGFHNLKFPQLETFAIVDEAFFFEKRTLYSDECDLMSAT